MKRWILLLAVVGTPVIADGQSKGGLPALQGEVAALRNEVAVLQQQVAGLQRRGVHGIVWANGSPLGNPTDFMSGKWDPGTGNSTGWYVVTFTPHLPAPGRTACTITPSTYPPLVVPLVNLRSYESSLDETFGFIVQFIDPTTGQQMDPIVFSFTCEVY